LPDLATQILRCEANIAADRYLISLMARAADTPLLRRERLAAKAGLVLRQVELLSLLWDDQDEKAGFRPDQPRHPRGSGPIGGRWSGGAGTIVVEAADPASTVIVEPAGGKPGHHYVPQSLIRRLNLTPEARRLLMEATTGELEEGQNLYDADHRKYNEAVERHMMQFLRENQMGSRPMTADEAQRLLRSIWRSRDPNIRPFNSRLEWSNRRVRLYRAFGFVLRVIRIIFRRGR